MNTPGTLYKSTNKVNFLLLLPALVVAAAVAALVGYLYGLISYYNPIIYVNVLVLVVGLGGVMLGGLAGKAIARSRNFFADILFILVSAFASWHASWAYYYGIEHGTGMLHNLAQLGPVETFALNYASGHGMSISRLGIGGINLPDFLVTIFYVIEGAAFFVPVFFMRTLFREMHFCEHCNRTNDLYKYRYAIKPAHFERETAAAQRGDLSFMKQLKLVGKVQEIYPKPMGKEGTQVLKFYLSDCSKCRNSALVDLLEYQLVMDERNKEYFKNKKVLLPTTYYDVRTVDLDESTGTNFF